MYIALIALILGIILLVWSADKFVAGAAAAACHLGVSPLIIGMVVVGFGTSIPEMLISALASLDGNPGIALGNAYGSNIANIALILGTTAIISPIAVHSSILKKELPVLFFVTLATAYFVWDGTVTRPESLFLLFAFALIMFWTIRAEIKRKDDILLVEAARHISASMPVKQALFWIIAGIVLLLTSSRILVWGAVELAHYFGVDDLIIGLTVVALGTSLPELASSLAAVKKGEHDLVLGNILGSNLFNTLVVVGIAGATHPLAVSGDVLKRDVPVMTVLTLSLFFFCWGCKNKQGKINRRDGIILLLCYAVYTIILLSHLVIRKT